ncbi:MAG: hypothetical protein JNK68_15495, partial [Betaproteobacteria bacterium]|nr:hypothetical protein [Betaproteobacteria bacterium]
MTTTALAIADWLRHGRSAAQGGQPDWRRIVGLAIIVGGAILLFATWSGQLSAFLVAHPQIRDGVFASLLAGLATGVGALPLLVMRAVSERIRNPALGFGAGVMVSHEIIPES